jgi:hypothetical protein
MAGGRPDAYPDLPFVVDPAYSGRNDDGFASSDDAGRRLEEDERLVRDDVAQLRGVGVIVTPYTDDLGWP